jgi:hypothetical protein
MLLNIYLTSRPAVVCQNHRNISCTLVKFSLRAQLALEQDSLARKNCHFFRSKANISITNERSFQKHYMTKSVVFFEYFIHKYKSDTSSVSNFTAFSSGVRVSVDSINDFKNPSSKRNILFWVWFRVTQWLYSIYIQSYFSFHYILIKYHDAKRRIAIFWHYK